MKSAGKREYSMTVLYRMSSMFYNLLSIVYNRGKYFTHPIFIMILVNIIIAIIVILAIILLALQILTWISEKSPYQKMFAEGKLPAHAPDGFHPGTAHVLFDKQTPWLGKSFVAHEHKGFNIFTPTGAAILKWLTPLYKLFAKNQDGNIHAYNFKTSKEKGIKDPKLDVIRLDYSAPENPWVIRIIVDEIVEIAPHQFLGKIHIKLGGLFFTIGYFGLKKEARS